MHRLLADLLEGQPARVAGNGRWETDGRQALCGGEVGDFQIDLPRPQGARHLRQRWYCRLSEVSAPLRPRGLLAIGEVERVHDVAALPAAIRRRVAFG
jgi:hypothetical protein